MARKVELQAPNGKAWLLIVEGVVTHINSQRWSDTYVSSSGGGGYVGSEGGYVSAPAVRSNVQQRSRLEFWIRENNQTEHHIVLEDSNFAVAPGHRIRMAWGGNVTNERGPYLFASNFTSNEFWNFKKGN